MTRSARRISPSLGAAAYISSLPLPRAAPPGRRAGDEGERANRRFPRSRPDRRDESEPSSRIGAHAIPGPRGEAGRARRSGARARARPPQGGPESPPISTSDHGSQPERAAESNRGEGRDDTRLRAPLPAAPRLPREEVAGPAGGRRALPAPARPGGSGPAIGPRPKDRK